LGFMVEGSTGARAVAMLKGMPQGTIIDTPEFAMLLAVKPGALHQLLDNAVKLRLIKKIRRRGSPCIGWALGAGNESAIIVPRRIKVPLSHEEIELQLARAERRRLAAESPPPPLKFHLESPWPPGFVSNFESPEVRAREFRPGWLVYSLKRADARAAPSTESPSTSDAARWNFAALLRVHGESPKAGRLGRAQPGSSMRVMRLDVRRDAARRDCLEDWHRVTGGGQSCNPKAWLSQPSVKYLVAELGSASDPAGPAPLVRTAHGTFAVRALADRYERWAELQRARTRCAKLRDLKVSATRQAEACVA
jgi:hypothetical protein